VTLVTASTIDEGVLQFFALWLTTKKTMRAGKVTCLHGGAGATLAQVVAALVEERHLAPGLVAARVRNERVPLVVGNSAQRVLFNGAI
jgi:hypothetical protein